MTTSPFVSDLHLLLSILELQRALHPRQSIGLAPSVLASLGLPLNAKSIEAKVE